MDVRRQGESKKMYISEESKSAQNPYSIVPKILYYLQLIYAEILLGYLEQHFTIFHTDFIFFSLIFQF